jgi:DNA polymerase sigma
LLNLYAFFETKQKCCQILAAAKFPPSREASVKELQTTLQRKLRAQFDPTCVVQVYGSMCNGFAVQHSDLDFCLALVRLEVVHFCIFNFEDRNHKHGTAREILTKVTQVLQSQTKEFSSVEAVLHARVPVVKFASVDYGFHCE